MNDVKFSLVDNSGILKENEILKGINDYSSLLQTVKNGETQYQDSLGWHDVEEWAGDEWLTRYEGLAKKVQEEADVLVVVGVGGSNQAARAVIDGLSEKSGVKILWAGNNISAYSMNEVLTAIEGKRVYIDVIAKNFETLEPGIAFRALRTALKKQYGEKYYERIICTGTIGSHLAELCKLHGYTFLPFPENIGGRYTAMSPVGLFPMAVAGMNIRAMAAGAKHMQNRLRSQAPEESEVLRFAVIRNLLYQKGYYMEMLSFFEPRLFRFAKWWMQLFAESEGKDDKGLYPLFGNYSEDLHSIGQFVQSGTPVLYEIFIDICAQDSSCILQENDIDDRFQYLNGKDFHEINKAAYMATLKAHSKRFPCCILQIPALDEESFGQMFYFFEFVCYLSGKILGINPFDQPGVEAYKEQMFQILGK